MPIFTPTFRSHPAFHLAGIRRWHTMADAPRNIPPQWNQLHALTIPNRTDLKVMYGATAQMDAANHRFEYLAGFEVDTFDGLPEDLGRMIVPAAEYAVFALASVKEIQPLWQHVFSTWLPTSGLKLSHASPDFERYDERFDENTRGPLELWLPLERQ